jgi:hypothetical protein
MMYMHKVPHKDVIVEVRGAMCCAGVAVRVGRRYMYMLGLLPKRRDGRAVWR